jgi:hypothetical protein
MSEGEESDSCEFEHVMEKTFLKINLPGGGLIFGRDGYQAGAQMPNSFIMARARYCTSASG